MLHRWPALYVMVAPLGRVTFQPTWRAGQDTSIPITFADLDDAPRMMQCATELAGLCGNGIFPWVPGMQGAVDDKTAIDLMMFYRNQIHRAMGWAAGPLRR